jgi:hypothetical protein
LTVYCLTVEGASATRLKENLVDRALGHGASAGSHPRSQGLSDPT